MNYNLLCLAFGSALLTVCVGLLLWTKIRVIRLRIDLLKIRKELRSKVKAIEKLNDKDYLALDDVMSSIIEQSHLITTSGYIYSLISDKRSSEDEDPFGGVDDPVLRAILRHAMLKVSARLMFYITSETASGLLISVLPLATIGMLAGLLAIARSVPLIWGTYKPDGGPMNNQHLSSHAGA